VTAPFKSKLTQSSIYVSSRLQQMLAVPKSEPVPPEPKQVLVVSITVHVD
jgi:hypothetical protein